MRPPYEPTSVTRPVPPSVKSQVEQAVNQSTTPGVQTNVTVNVVNRDSGAGTVCLWIFLSPVVLFGLLIALGVIVTYPWLLTLAFIGFLVWALCRVSR